MSEVFKLGQTVYATSDYIVRCKKRLFRKVVIKEMTPKGGYLLGNDLRASYDAFVYADEQDAAAKGREIAKSIIAHIQEGLQRATEQAERDKAPFKKLLD